MAYPFEQAPTVEDFISNLTENYGCELRTLPSDLTGPRGDTKIRFLARTASGVLLFSEPLPSDLQDRLSPDSARRLIVQLRLPSECWRWAGDPYDLD